VSEFEVRDMTLGEMKAVLATIVGVQAEDVQDWLLAVRIRCTEHDGAECAGGDLAVMSSRMHEGGADQLFVIHMAAGVIADAAADLHHSAGEQA
jgi:hypothetical protein